MALIHVGLSIGFSLTANSKDFISYDLTIYFWIPEQVLEDRNAALLWEYVRLVTALSNSYRVNRYDGMVEKVFL